MAKGESQNLETFHSFITLYIYDNELPEHKRRKEMQLYKHWPNQGQHCTVLNFKPVHFKF